VLEKRRNYDPEGIIEKDVKLSRVMELLEKGHFNQFEPGIFDPLIHSIRSPDDPWMVTADFDSYVQAQERAAAAYGDKAGWVRSSILNSASSGKFSTDRTMQEYNRDIWKLKPVPSLPIDK
jgi:starch phosphorylase